MSRRSCVRVLRLYDWECQSCHDIGEDLVEVPSGELPPMLWDLYCPVCDKQQRHRRMLPAPHPAGPDINPCSPMVNGGRFDTTGMRQLPGLPDLPPSAERSADNYRALFATPEHKDALQERRARKAENAARKRRADLIRQGKSINMRSARLPGDPKI